MSTRTCKDCHQTKPVADYYVYKSGSITMRCKDCTRARARQHRQQNIEKARAYDRQRASSPKRVAERAAYRSTPEWRAKKSIWSKVHNQRNPIKKAARQAICNAIQAGKIIQQPCEKCGAFGQAHHDDYSKPFDIRWLCAKHHAEWHKHNKALCPDQSEVA